MNVDSESTDRKNTDRTDRTDAVLGAVRSWAAEARERPGTHPTSDVLLAYHERELASGEAEGVREHLALCSECTQRALDLEPLCRRALSEQEAEPSAEAAEAWQSTRRALVWDGLLRAAPALPPKAEGSTWHSLLGPRLAYASAAILLLTTIGLSVRLADAGRSLSELRRPRANVLLEDLYPLGTGAQRAGDSPQPTAESDDDLVLILHLLDSGSYTSYRVAVFRLPPSGLLPSGAAPDLPDRTVWSTDTLKRSPEGDFTVLIPRRLLAAGPYRIRLYGLGGERPDLLAEYALYFAAR